MITFSAIKLYVATVWLFQCLSEVILNASERLSNLVFKAEGQSLEQETKLKEPIFPNINFNGHLC